MSSFFQPPAFSLVGQTGGDTDIGGGRENQDDYFVWTAPAVPPHNQRAVVLCVLDGHGRDVGKVAANTARRALLEYFTASVAELWANPYECLVKAHTVAHSAIKESFRIELERQGYQISEGQGGYLLKRKPDNTFWSCVHGGSSCSIVAMLGSKCYIANVGDSSGIISACVPGLSPTLIKSVGDSAKGGLNKSDGGTITGVSRLGPPSETMVITAEHSPESPEEFIRLRDFRCNERDSRVPALVVVYDSPSAEKTSCPEVFSLDAGGNPLVTNNGRYYKNVRKEWASLVSTPNTAAFQDALAFTRSLGDLHLHTYGVTHLPEVQCLDLAEVFGSLQQSQKVQAAAGGAAPVQAGALFCVVLATDGVWDNWLFEDVTKFVMDGSCVQAAMAGADGAQRVAQSFMQRNTIYARRNFGNQADNATGIVAYFSHDPTVIPDCITPSTN